MREAALGNARPAPCRATNNHGYRLTKARPETDGPFVLR